MLKIMLLFLYPDPEGPFVQSRIRFWNDQKQTTDVSPLPDANFVHLPSASFVGKIGYWENKCHPEKNLHVISNEEVAEAENDAAQEKRRLGYTGALSQLAYDLYHDATKMETILTLNEKFGQGNWIELKTAQGKSGGIFGFNPRTNKFTFVGRGTVPTDKNDLFINASFVAGAIVDDNTSVEDGEYDIISTYKVHAGFASRFDALKQPILDFALKMCDIHKTNFRQTQFEATGHSLGGALANLAAVEFRNLAGMGMKKVQLTTQATPCVAQSENWKNVFEKHIDALTIDRASDLVPKAGRNITANSNPGRIHRLHDIPSYNPLKQHGLKKICADLDVDNFDYISRKDLVGFDDKKEAALEQKSKKKMTKMSLSRFWNWRS